MARDRKIKSEKVILASDHAGFKLKEVIKKFLIKKRKKVLDLGTKNANSVDYPDYAHLLAKKMKRSKKIIVLADSSKFSYIDGCYSSISLDKIDTLITDSNIEAKNIKMLEKYNINVIIV